MSATQAASTSLVRLTKYPIASLRELISLSIPLILMLFSSSFMGFCSRLFLAHHSLEALEACASAVYLTMLFQLPCMRVTSMAQIFVGMHKGASQPYLIGPCIWQMIWFSLFSMLITLPLGNFAGPFFLQGLSIEKPAMVYFQSLMWGNFLFPLGAALAAFYTGRGKTKTLFIAMAASHALNILLDYLLIFGIEGVLPSMGIRGAAIATLTAQTFFCTILLLLFLNKSARETFNTDKFALKWKTFWSYVQLSIPRAIARMILLISWCATARIITLKGGDFLVVLSVGSSLFLLFSFINEGMGQGMMTVASSLIGAKEYSMLEKLTRSAFTFLALSMLVLTIPFIFFPKILLSFFFVTPPSVQTLAILEQSCLWLWVALLCNGINMIGFSLITSACDTVFHMIANSFVWLTCFLPVYLAFKVGSWPADKIWLLMALDGLVIGTGLLLRAYRNHCKPEPYARCHSNLTF